MVSLILILLLIFGFFIGRRRGFILQSIHLAGFFVAIFIAYRYHAALAEKFAYTSHIRSFLLIIHLGCSFNRLGLSEFIMRPSLLPCCFLGQRLFYTSLGQC